MSIQGEFHARLTGDRVEAWLGDERPTLWPADYYVRFNPGAELIGVTGEVVAREGDAVHWAGGIRGEVLWLQAGPGQPPR